MGVLASRVTTESKKETKTETKKMTKTGKPVLAVIGTSQSGKSTVCMQRALFERLSEEERLKYKNEVYRRIVYDFLCILGGDVQLADESLLEETGTLLEYYKNPKEISIEILDLLKRLSDDIGLQAYVEKTNEDRSLDSLAYFLKNKEWLHDKNYTPTVQDVIMRSRVPTVGLISREAIVNGVTLTLMEGGGTRRRRAQWIHFLDSEDLKAIVYVASIADYYKVLMEDINTNRLDECLKLWEGIIKFPLVAEIPFFLVFNKRDLLEETVNKIPFGKYHEEYNGGNTFSEVSEYIKNLYLDIAKKNGRDVPVYFVSALDTEQIHSTFESIADTLGIGKEL